MACGPESNFDNLHAGQRAAIQPLTTPAGVEGTRLFTVSIAEGAVSA
jgi:hypothetical protein